MKDSVEFGKKILEFYTLNGFLLKKSLHFLAAILEIKSFRNLFRRFYLLTQ